MAEEQGGGGSSFGDAPSRSLGKRRATDTGDDDAAAARGGDTMTWSASGVREGGGESSPSTEPQESAGAVASSHDGASDQAAPPEVEAWRFKPSVKIRRIDDSILINTVVVKEQSLTSVLFAVLEQEGLDIVYENQYRTETKVAHTILVKLPPTYDIVALRRRLCQWAGADPFE